MLLDKILIVVRLELKIRWCLLQKHERSTQQASGKIKENRVSLYLRRGATNDYTRGSRLVDTAG